MRNVIVAAGVGILACTLVAIAVSPPTTPTGLAGHQGSGPCVELTWNASLDDATPQNEIRYEVQRNQVDIGHTVGVTTFTDSVPPGTYSYRVRAVDEDGFASAFTASITVSVGGCVRMYRPEEPRAVARYGSSSVTST